MAPGALSARLWMGVLEADFEGEAEEKVEPGQYALRRCVTHRTLGVSSGPTRTQFPTLWTDQRKPFLARRLSPC